MTLRRCANSGEEPTWTGKALQEAEGERTEERRREKTERRYEEEIKLEEEKYERRLHFEKKLEKGSKGHMSLQNLMLVSYTPFNGTHADWLGFWNQFEEEIDFAQIPMITKFSYLK